MEDWEDVAMNYNYIKALAKERECSIKDLLALSDVNDPFYIRPADKARAEWVAMIWHQEYVKPIHPRGFYYKIIDLGLIMPDKTEYINSHHCWMYLQDGIKYARLLGLIDWDNVLDEKNTVEIITSDFSQHEEITHDKPFGFQNVEFEEGDDEDKFMNEIVSNAAGDFDVGYNSNLLQPFYLELWAEKSSITPEHIARRFGATMRPAGGGEFSFAMCRKALLKAQELDKPLIIFMLTDLDPKGHDMRKSVSRKIEFLAQQMNVTAYVIPIALTKIQCEKYNLPSSPAKIPKGSGSGAKAYITQTNTFNKAIGRESTEINSLMEKYEDDYHAEIENSITNFYDEDMKMRVNELVKEIEDQIEDCIRIELEKERNEIVAAALNLTKAKKELDEYIEMKTEELGIHEKQEQFNNVTEINPDAIMDSLDIELPISEVPAPKDALLDTNRSYLDQLAIYKKNDVRNMGAQDE